MSDTPIADAIRSEATGATRPGQYERLMSLAKFVDKMEGAASAVSTDSGDYKPTETELEFVLKVLLWLYEWADDGALRDDISHVRFVLDELIAEGETW